MHGGADLICLDNPLTNQTGNNKTRQDNLESILFDSFNQLLMAPPVYTLLALAASVRLCMNT